jgi:WD40 repeat protein
MDRYISDDQLDRVVTHLLAERGDEIEATALTPAAVAARIQAKRTAFVPRSLVWAGSLALLAVAMLAATWALVGEQPTPSLTFTSGSIAFVRGGGVYLAAADGSEERTLHPYEMDETIQWIAFAPDAGTLAFGGYDDLGVGTVYLLTPEGEELSVPRDLGGSIPPTAFDWSPDGERLVTWSGRYPSYALAIVGIHGQVERTIPLPGFARATVGPETGPLWSPDGRWIAVGGCEAPCDSKRDTHVLLVAADGSESRWLTQGRSMPDQSMAWSPDSRLAIGRSESPIVEVLSTDGSVLEEVTLPDDLGAAGFAWSPDGSQLAVQGWNGPPGRLVVIASDGTPAVIPTDPISFAGPVHWSSDGEAVLFTNSSWDGSAEWDGAADDLWAVDATGGTPRVLLRDVAGPFDRAPE